MALTRSTQDILDIAGITKALKSDTTVGGVAESLNLKANIASPALTGVPTVPTAAAGVNTDQIASTAFVSTAVANLVATAPATLNTLNELALALGNDPNFATTITNSLALKAPLVSPALTGVPTVPTAVAGTNTTQIASAAFVSTAAANAQAAAIAAAAIDATTKANAAQAAAAIDATTKANAAQAAAIAAASFNIVYVPAAPAVHSSVGVSLAHAHGLGVLPRIIWLEYTCVIAEQGWAVGDIIKISDVWDGGTAFSANLWASTTTIGLPIGPTSVVMLRNKTNNNAFSPTAANWRYRFGMIP